MDAGALVNFDDVDEFKRTVEEIFNNYDYWKKKTLNAKNYIIKNLSFNARINEYIDLYINKYENTCIKPILLA